MMNILLCGIVLGFCRSGHKYKLSKHTRNQTFTDLGAYQNFFHEFLMHEQDKEVLMQPQRFSMKY